MSIATTDLILYGSANRPTADGTTSGGAIDATMRPVFTQFGSNAVLSLQSDGADTRTAAVTGRNAAGEYTTENIVLNGTTPVLSVNTYERILSVQMGATDASRTITAKQGSGGSTIATIPVNEKGFYALFINSTTPSSSTQARYEKIFWKNTHGTLSLTSSTVTLTADPSSKITIALDASLDGSTSVAARTTSPGLTFVSTGVAQNVANSQNLTAGSAQAVWIKELLTAGDAAAKSTFTTQLQGATA